MIDLLGTLIDWVRAAVGGWRFLFSSTYRRKKADEWKVDDILGISWDIFCRLAGIVFSLLMVYWVSTFF